MRITIADVFQQLAAEGLAPAGAVERARDALRAGVAEEMPWYLRTMVALGAWAATGFLLGFFFAIAGLRSSIMRIVLGVLLVALAVWARRTTRAEFLRQAAVAASLAGQGLVLSGVGEQLRDMKSVALVSLVMAVVMLRVMPDWVHRFLVSLFGAGAVIVFFADMKGSYMLDVGAIVLISAAAYVWRFRLRERRADVAEMLEPVAYALVVALFALLLTSLATHGAFFFRELGATRRAPAVGPLTTTAFTLALAALAWSVLEEHGTPLNSPIAFAALLGVIALGAGALSSPGIVASAAVLTLAFDRRDPVLLGMAVVFVIVFGAAYYYNLDLTLLQKSGVLAGSGLLLLAIRSRVVPRGAA